MKNSKNKKRIIASSLTVALASNSFVSVALAVTNDKGADHLDFENILSLNDNDESKVSVLNKYISQDVDLKSEDNVPIIVEFKSEPLVVEKKNGSSIYSRKKSGADRDHEKFENFLANKPSTMSDGGIKVRYSYKEVFNGVALDIKGTEISELILSGVVKKIYKDNIVQTEPPIKKDNKESIIAPIMADAVPQMGVDKLHDEGITGDGIKVGVLDTGIDYNHPDLTEVYKGFRSQDGDPTAQDIDSIKGWDFVDNDADPMETTYKEWLDSGEPEFDSQGNPYYTSHGTHVSGIIAGTASNDKAETPILGVAPDVDLYVYRVLGHRGSGSTSGIIGGVEKSVTDGMDVINMSLGNGGINDPFDPMVTAVNNASLAGVVTVISAGNSGPNSYTIGAPGTAQLPISVGASNVDFKYNRYMMNIGEEKVLASHVGRNIFGSVDKLQDIEYDVVYCGLGNEDDFKDKDVTGKIVLVDRGVLTFAQKADNASKAGAALIVVANNLEESDEKYTPIPYLGENKDINVFGISKADGEIIKENIENKLSFKFNDVAVIKGDNVESFSSVGPVKITYEIRPDVVAPGAQVNSTAPEFINDTNPDEDHYEVAYQRMSGTSMAAPNVAGVAALVLAKNPEYTPEDVKAAIMNTSKKLYKDDKTNYSVHEIGAGRVEAYEAVHETVDFKANYKVTAGLDHQEYDNVTGMLSYGKFYNTPDDKKSTIPVTITNNSDSEKEYNVSVEYSTSNRATDAVANGLKLDIVDTIKVKAGGQATVDATLNISSNAAIGNYEGFINFKEVNGKNDYQMPFGATVTKDGFVNLAFPGMENDYAKGISAFTSSRLFDRHPESFGIGDISVIVQISEPTKYLHALVKEPGTGKYIGYGGRIDASWIPEGIDVVVDNIVPNGKVNKLIGDKVSLEQFPMENGIYELELYGETYTGKTYKESTNIAIINDNKGSKADYNYEGIVEVSEDMFTKEVWFDEQEHEGIWISVDVFDETVDKLQKDYGMDFLKQEELNTIFARGNYPDGHAIRMSTMSKPGGKVMVAGVERADLEDGFFKVTLDHTNPARISNKPHTIVFVKPEEQYLSLDTDNTLLNEKAVLNTSISLNNGLDVSEGTFELESYGDAKLVIKSIKPSEELKNVLDKNNADIDITNSVANNGKIDNFNIGFKITGKNSDSIKGLNGDIKLFDIVFEVESLKGIGSDVKIDTSYNKAIINGVNSSFKNSKGEDITVHAGTIVKSFDVESNERTLIMAETFMPMGGMFETEVFAVDPDGKEYKPTYCSYDEVNGRMHNFAFNDLPVIDGDYKIVQRTPGAFDTIVSVPGSKIGINGNRVGNDFGIISESFMSSAMQVYLGDTNGDGAIDVLDAMEIAKEYEKTEIDFYSSDTDEDKIVRDLNQDGKVNIEDMEIIKYSYLLQDYANPNSKTPLEVYEGRDLIDVLEYCGYLDEDYYEEMNVTLELDKESAFVGDEVKLLCIPATDEVEFEYEFSVRGENDSDWTVIQKRSPNKEATWISDKNGKYETKVRVFLDNIQYVWQDNKDITVDWKALEEIKLDKESLNLTIGEESTLNVSTKPEIVAPQEYLWSSSNEDVITVENGVVKAIGEGEAVVTVETSDKSLKSTCKVKVSPIKLESIKLSEENLELKKDDSKQLDVTFNPENATNKEVVWTSSDESVATVKDGLVTAVAKGKAVITVKSVDGDLVATCEVIVTEDNQQEPGQDDPQEPGKDDPQGPGQDNPQGPGQDDSQEPGQDDSQEKPGNDSDDKKPGNNSNTIPDTGSLFGTQYLIIGAMLLLSLGVVILRRRRITKE